MVKKCGIILIFYTLSIMLVAWFLTSSPITYVSMMIEVDDSSQAIALSERYHIELFDVSDFGFATFLVPEDQSFELTEMGFEYDQTLVSMGRIQPITNDPYVNDQYALSLMKVPEAWLLADGSSSVIIAIIDTGIDTDHDEFVGRILPNSYNARTKVTSTTSLNHIEDDNGHGTMVAGIIAANKNNSKGIAGIVSESPLLIIKANNADDPLTSDDESKEFSDSVIAEGIHYARQQGADIINLSLGSTTQNTIVRNAVTEAQNAGIIVIGASGNDGATTKYYPASYPGVISVGSVDESLMISSFSNYNDAVDVTAPGSQIVSSTLNNGYSMGSGTSFAAPQVTGVIALMLDYFSTLTVDQIISQLLSTTIDRGAIGYDVYYGYGVIHAANALDVEFVTIMFETNGGSLIEPLEVVKGYTFEIDPPIKEGYIFIGWYTDLLLTQPFQIGVDVALQSMTLYADYEPLRYALTLIHDTEVIFVLEVFFGIVPLLPIPDAPIGYDFAGWFYDPQLTIPYQQDFFTSDDTLYAGYVPKLYEITYWVGDEIFFKESYPYQTIPDTPTPSGTYPFIGWYLDASLTQAYYDQPITESRSLYARFDDGQYRVTFYSYDGITILSSLRLSYGEDAIPPENPIRPDSPSFTFTFLGWSESFLNITHDVSIFPIYDKMYHPESITLQPYVDTVHRFEDWEDAGLTLIDPLLHVTTEIETIDPTTYRVVYRIYDGDEWIDTRIRMVTILPEDTVIITVLPDVTTLYVGQPYQDAGATSSIGQLETINPVDTRSPGIYEIIYRVTIGYKTYQKSKFVHVLDEQAFHPTPVLVYRRKEEGWMV